MEKHFVKWKSVTCTSKLGHSYDAEIPKIIDIGYKGTLLTRILKMKKQNPLSFDEAIRMSGKRFLDSKIGHEKGESFWYWNNFVQWISDQGYHIELTGDEFETFVKPEQVA